MHYTKTSEEISRCEFLLRPRQETVAWIRVGAVGEVRYNSVLGYCWKLKPAGLVD